MNRTQNLNDEQEIDLLHLAKVLWQKIWIIAISTILCGVIAFSYSRFFITPQYKARAMMYVNNSSISVGNTKLSISSAELSAAKSLLDIYIIILGSRTTLEAVIDRAGLDYTYEEISKLVSAKSVNSTEVFEVVATNSDPAKAKLIVDTIIEILPDRIADILDGSSARIIDTAVIPTEKASPSNTKNAAMGMLIGMVLSCGCIVVHDLLNNTIRDEDYLTEKYDFPLLAVIPDMQSHGHGKSYGYSKSRYYYRSHSSERKGAAVGK